MELWFIVVLTLCVAALIRSISSSFSNISKNLPPGPPVLPIIGNFLLIRKSFSHLEPILQNLKLEYGPLFTLRIGSRPVIFISDHSLAHQALIEKGAIFSDRPRLLPVSRLLSSNQKNINSASYGPTWRLLRRNLTSEILHPSRVKSYTHARKWVLGILLHRLNSRVSGDFVVPVIQDLQYTMFCLLVLMCFGDKLGEEKIKEIEKVVRELLLNFTKFSILNFLPRLGRIVFRKRWQLLIQIIQKQEDLIIPLIKDRREFLRLKKQRSEVETMAYIDTLMDLELPEEEKRRLNDSEIVTLCIEFLTAGTDTTSTALQWVIANLVKYPSIQTKLYEEISGVMGPAPAPAPESFEREISEKDLEGMSYLKAVVLEGLRLHPPGHFVLPHRVTEDVELNGYLVPKDASVNFMVAELGRDPAVWEHPMEFKPERFIRVGDGGGGGEQRYELVDTDITGSKEIKMMPFGAGRRICPGMSLALLHMEYFLANLVWKFEWTAIEGDEIDLSEKLEFTVVMEKPLQAKLKPRSVVSK